MTLKDTYQHWFFFSFSISMPGRYQELDLFIKATVSFWSFLWDVGWRCGEVPRRPITIMPLKILTTASLKTSNIPFAWFLVLGCNRQAERLWRCDSELALWKRRPSRTQESQPLRNVLGSQRDASSTFLGPNDHTRQNHKNHKFVWFETQLW